MIFNPRVLLIGNPESGRSELMKKLSTDRYIEYYQMYGKPMHNKEVMGTINIAIFCYSINDLHTFEMLYFWTCTLKKQEKSLKNIVLALVGIETDSKKKREVSYENGLSYADYKNMYFFEISLIKPDGVENLKKWIEKTVKYALEEPYNPNCNNISKSCQ